MQAVNLRCEYTVNPLGIDETLPHLSWTINADGRNRKQSARQIQVASSREILAGGKGDLWDSGKVSSDQMTHIEYAGAPLASEMQCWWRVKLWDEKGTEGGWSEAAFWKMGLLKDDNWKAKWIGGGCDVPYLRRSFDIQKPIKRAFVYATALGLYELYLNGRKAGDHVLTPGWTDYHKRIYYQTYDVTETLRHGENIFSGMIAPGWQCGHIGFDVKLNYYSKEPLLKAQINIDFEDGSRQIVATDGTWRWSDGPIRMSDILHGEEYDARREMPGWREAAFDDSGWKKADVHELTTSPLQSHPGNPVRMTEEMPAQTVTQPRPGCYVFDLGQNIVGWIRIKVRGGSRGRRMIIRYGEMLNADGSVYTANLRYAQATDIYYMQGSGEEVWEQRFTYHGFRYVEVLGYPSKIFEPTVNVTTIDMVTGIVVNSDLPRTGMFECSHPKVNQLFSNICWGQRGNYLEIPTDCPQRDERLGWTGDAQVFVRTASYIADIQAFFKKWLIDLADAQHENGAVTEVAPYIKPCGNGTAGWGDAAVICPWTVYQMYGDKRLLERNYGMMAGWIEYLKLNSADLIRPEAGYGDWLSVEADTPKDLVATAYFAYSTKLMIHAAGVLGKKDDVKKYEELFAAIKAAYIKMFVNLDGSVKGGTQCAYLMSLHMDLLPENIQNASQKLLIADIEKRGFRLTTGFLGISYLNPTLSAIGRTDVAYKLLTQEEFPSWLYEVNQGATTIWERWDSWTRDKGFQATGMNSFNHYSFGSVGQWLFTTVAGIDMEEAGFRKLRLYPQPGGGLTHVKASYNSIAGMIKSHWRLEDTVWRWDIEVPHNTTANVYLPFGNSERISVDQMPLKGHKEIAIVKAAKEFIMLEVGSGSYSFTVKC